MGVSGPAAFAVLLIAVTVSFGMLYASGETLYSMMKEAGSDYNEMVVKVRTSHLELVNYSYSTLPNATVYDMTFAILNAGSTLSPNEWGYIYDGMMDSTSVVGPSSEYLLPGETAQVSVINVPKVNGTAHSLVISTEIGCGLKIKWEWLGNATDGAPRVIGSAWYCPGEG